MTLLRQAIAAAAALVAMSSGFAKAINDAEAKGNWSAAERATLVSMRLQAAGDRPADHSNAYERLPEAAALGKQLFKDTGLSANGQVACATCHLQDTQFQDGRPTGKGVGIGRRRTMPVMGASHSPFLFWDGRKDSLWSQALGPWEDELEHGGNRVALVKRVRDRHLDAYQNVFGKMPDLSALPAAASPNGTVDERTAWASLTAKQREDVNRAFANMGKAVAAFERTLSYGESRFDRYANALVGGRGSEGILTTQELRGLRLFLNQGQCSTCHNGPLLTDHAFHNTGVPPREPKSPDRGRSEGVLKLQQDEFNCLGRFSDAQPGQCAELEFLATDEPAQLGAFRTPSLRNVAARAPYMHAGQFATLDEVIAHYARSPTAALGHSELARPGELHQERQVIRLSTTDIQDLKAFLETLTGPVTEAMSMEATGGAD